MSNQRSILSFFSNSGALESSKTTLPQTSSKQTAPAPPPPPPPPPPSSRFVPPPPPRTGYSLPPGSAAAAAAAGPPSPALPSPRTPAPLPTLPAITPDQSRAILLQAGATQKGDDIVFDFSGSSSCRIVYPRPQHIPGLVSVNAILLPVRYQDSFYNGVADLARYGSLLNRFIVDEDDKVVGGVIGRLEMSPFDSAAGGQNLSFYIQSLALSSPFRGSGLMAATLASILRTIDVMNVGAESVVGLAGTPVTSLYCHVWTENDDALRWYKANGFRCDAPAPIANYYFKLQPNTAWVVRRDLAAATSAAAAATPSSVLEAVQAATKNQQGSAPPPKLQSSLSYQNSRPDMEWNDLPADMVTSSGPSSTVASRPVSTAPSAAGSMASSPNASNVNLADTATAGDSLAPPPRAGGTLKPSGTIRKKRERAYPAAMFQ